MVQMGEIPSQNQKNRGDKIFSAKFPSRKAISDLGPKKRRKLYKHGFSLKYYYTQSPYKCLKQ